MIRNLSCIFIFFILFSTISCKKKAASTPSSTPPAPTTTPSTLPFSVMQTDYTYLDNGSTLVMDSNVIAVFMQKPWGTINNVYISAGNVSLNDSDLNFVLDNYMKVNPINISQTLKWKATGSGTITPFTYTFVPSYPNYTGGSLLPDTCTLASGITLTVSGVSNLTGVVWVSVSQSSSGYTKDIPGNGTISFSASELSGFSINSNIQIEIRLQNTTSQNLGGVLHSFNNSLIYNKIAYLKL